MIPTNIKIALEIQTRCKYPSEMCGILLVDGTFEELPNISETPEVAFSFEPRHIWNKLAKIKYIIHSHTKKSLLYDIRMPSIEDVVLYETYQIPLAICGFDGHVYYQPIIVPPEPNNNFLGRPYIYGCQDCGFLARDYYLYTFGITLFMNPRWSLAHKSSWAGQILEFLRANNFISIKNKALRHGDLLIVDMGDRQASHGIIYIDEATILNQTDVSKYEPFELWQDKIRYTFRHMSLT